MPLCAAQMQKGKPGYNHSSSPPSPLQLPFRSISSTALRSTRIGPAWVGSRLRLRASNAICNASSIFGPRSRRKKEAAKRRPQKKRRPQFAMPHRRVSTRVVYTRRKLQNSFCLQIDLTHEMREKLYFFVQTGTSNNCDSFQN